MSLTRRLVCHLSVGLLAISTLTAMTSRPQAPQSTTVSRLTVLFQGQRIGGETVEVKRTDAGWIISATGQIAPPLDLTTTRFEATYAADWQPLKLSVEGTFRGQLITLSTVFASTSATSDVLSGGQRGSVTHTVSPRTIVLPNNFFAAYEALAAQLGSAAVGAKFPVYVAPQREVTVTVDAVRQRRVVTADGPIDLQQFDLTFGNPSGPTKAEMWVDGSKRLARLLLPATGVTVIRDDLSAVLSREERITHPGDEDVFIPASGFNLGATISRPKEPGVRLPAVILVAGSGRQDRDEMVFGIPILGQLAGTLADAGFLVVRYDKRGVGLSGGRVESATLEDYAGDVVSVVNWLRSRKDVDPDRIAVVGHSEGGAVAMLAADRQSRIKAIGLVGTPGLTGKEVTLEQQQHALARSPESEEDKKAKVALELRIIDAALTGQGWEGIPPALRQQAETAWFKSWLQFDPAAVMKKIDQPVLIVHGALDTQVPPAHADRLESLARGRKARAAAETRKVIVAGVNHLLVPAKTGEADEYMSLPTKVVSPEIGQAITDWLRNVLK